MVCGLSGKYDITIKHKDGEIEKQSINNRLTNLWINKIRDAYNGEAVDLELKYLALGDSDAPINDDDTSLSNERFRTSFISQTKSQTGQLQSTALIQEDEAVFHIREIGVYAGGSDEKDSGILISRILWERDKTNLESIQFVRTDTIRRG